jgi:hypothetical protein
METPRENHSEILHKSVRMPFIETRCIAIYSPHPCSAQPIRSLSPYFKTKRRFVGKTAPSPQNDENKIPYPFAPRSSFPFKDAEQLSEAIPVTLALSVSISFQIG